MYRANRNTSAQFLPPTTHTREFVSQSICGRWIEEAVHKARLTTQLTRPIGYCLMGNVGAGGFIVDWLTVDRFEGIWIFLLFKVAIVNIFASTMSHMTACMWNGELEVMHPRRIINWLCSSHQHGCNITVWFTLIILIHLLSYCLETECSCF